MSERGAGQSVGAVVRPRDLIQDPLVAPKFTNESSFLGRNSAISGRSLHLDAARSLEIALQWNECFTLGGLTTKAPVAGGTMAQCAARRKGWR